MSKLSDTKHRTTVFIPMKIKNKIPDKINLSGLIRDLLEDYVNGNKWKKGFKEFNTLFEDVVFNAKQIIKDVSAWNQALNKRDLDLIDKLAGELNE